MGPRLGSGVTGTVFEATRADGKLCAIKVFETMSSNPALLANRISRIRESALSGVTVPILGQTLDARPACIVMPVMDTNLQLRLGDYFEGEDAWSVVNELAESLAKLHGARVAHGNMKPGNIFFDAQGKLLLADYASGLMPEVHRMAYTDALLYAPPEQLRQPGGYLNEAGYRWDVYAFGVLAFRLLNRIFPRCDELFKTVSPEPGTTKRFNIEADYEGIAKGLETAHLAAWKTEAVSEAEKRQRHIIEHCLALNPLERPTDMMDVHHRLAEIDAELAREAERNVIVLSERKAHKKKKAFVLLAQVLGVTAVLLGGLWQFTQFKRSREAGKAQEKFDFMEESKDTLIAGLETGISKAQESEATALAQQKKIQAALDNEQSKALAELESAQLTNDQLMAWVLEKGVAGLPTLQGRPGRLQALVKPLRDQLEGIQSRAGLEKQSATLRLRLAELMLAAGDTKGGGAALAEAIEKGTGVLDAKKMTRARLRGLLLSSEDSQKPISEEEITALSKAVNEAWAKTHPESMRARAALSLVRGRAAEQANNPKKALTEYYAALSLYRQLNLSHPESPALYFTLGRVYLKSGEVAEGAGAVDDATTLKNYAAAQFLKLSKIDAGKTPEIDYQIASATAAKAVTAWQLGRTFEAEKIASAGLGKLNALANKMPDDFRVRVDLASQQGIIATALRDEGKTRQASKLLEQAIKPLEEGLKKHPDDLKARYLLASLQWQMCGLLGQAGAGEDEVELGLKTARPQSIF